jgi:hypothetical protein
VVVLGAEVGCVVEADCDPAPSLDCCGGAVDCVVGVGGRVVLVLGTDPVVFVVVAVAAELEPGRSCATATPMSAVKPVAANAVSRVSRLSRRWARSLATGEWRTCRLSMR